MTIGIHIFRRDLRITDNVALHLLSTKVDKIIPTLRLEYTDMIRDYINSQKYDSDKIKGGVLEEFNEVTKIYRDNYRDK